MTHDGRDPMNQDQSIRQSESALPDDVRDVALLLDRDAAATRAMPDASFEARLAMRTRPVPARQEESHPRRSLPHVDAWGHHRNARPLWAARLAAALAVTGGLVAAWMGVQPTGTPSTGAPSTVATLAPNANDDIELAFAIAGLSEQSSSSLDELRLQAESIDSTIRQGIDMTELFGEEGST